MNTKRAIILTAFTLFLSLSPLQAFAVTLPPDTYKASTTAGGQDANNVSNREPVISANGRYVTFLSEASNLVPNDTNGLMDAFRKDTDTGEVIRLDVDNNGKDRKSVV